MDHFSVPKLALIVLGVVASAAHGQTRSGSVFESTLNLTAPANFSVAPGAIAIVDTTPAGCGLVVADFAGSGSGPARFSAGSSGLTYGFQGLASTSDDIEFSNDGGASWTYVPVPAADGVDPAVTHVRLRPKAAMAAGTTVSVRLRYRVR